MPDISSRRYALWMFLSNYRGFGGQGKLLILMGLFGGLGGAFISFVLVLYTDAIGFSPVFFGTLMLINEASMALLLLPSGILSRRYDTRILLMIGAILTIIGNSIYLTSPDKTIYLGAAAVAGVGNAFFSPAYLARLAGNTDEARRKYFFSIQSFTSMIGFSTAMLVAGSLPDLAKNITPDGLFGYRLAIGIGVFFFVLELITVLLIKKEGAKKQGKKGGEKARISLLFRRSKDAKTIIKFAIPSIFMGMGAGAFIPFLQLQFKLRFDLVPTEIGIIFAFTQIIMAAAILVLPMIAERIGSVHLIVRAEMLATVALVLMPLSAVIPVIGLELFVGLSVVRTIFMNMTGPVSNSFAMSRVSPENRGLTSSVITVSWIGTHSIGSFLGGYIMEMSLDLPFYICAAFYTAAIVTYYTFFRKLDDKPENQRSRTEPSVE